MGGSVTQDYGFTGTIYEIIVYDSALSNPDRQAVETYHLNKY